MGDEGHDALTQLLRELAPRVLGATARRCADFAAAEDAVQEALLAAAATWPERGVPKNPGGWLFTVAMRRLHDHLDAERGRARREAMVAADRPEAAAPVSWVDDSDLATTDETLRLLFLCCHETLSPPSAIALTLRAVGGLSTVEIARAFLVTEAAMAQRISRAKKVIAAAGATFALPGTATADRRLELVLNVLYLMFTEAHTASAGDDLTRVDLAIESIRLARILCRLVPEHSEAEGLLALLLLSDARRPARTGSGGEIVPLQDQNRSLWNREAIEEGRAIVTAALARGRVGSYQIQAAIATLHDEAASFEATDWPQILALYTLLGNMTRSPVVALNRAVAVAMVHGAPAGLAALASLAGDDRLATGHRLEAVRGHLLEMAGEHAAAAASYRAAAAAAANELERSYLSAKAAACEGHA